MLLFNLQDPLGILGTYKDVMARILLGTNRFDSLDVNADQTVVTWNLFFSADMSLTGIGSGLTTDMPDPNAAPILTGGFLNGFGYHEPGDGAPSADISHFNRDATVLQAKIDQVHDLASSKGLNGDQQATALINRIFDNRAQKINGSDGDDYLKGGNKADIINGNGGIDHIIATKGDDTIHGGGEIDSITFEELSKIGALTCDLGTHKATLGDLAGLTAEQVIFGVENVTGTNKGDGISGDFHHNLLFGGGGGDTISGRGGNDTIYGQGGKDLLFGKDGNDQIFGGNGNDVIEGNAGNDDLFGDAGKDSIYGNAGDDFMSGGDGPDLLLGGGADDSMIGGAQNDTMIGQGGNDSMDGGAGSDSMKGSAGFDSMLGGAQNDTLLGQGGNDTLDGGTGIDSLHGNGGKDSIKGGGGADTMFGDAGADTLLGGSAPDSIRGGGGDDKILGQAGADVIYGEDGNDTIDGGKGSDTIGGSSGNDRLTGGDDNDSFEFYLGDVDGEGRDTITDMRLGDSITIFDDEKSDLVVSAGGGGTNVHYFNGVIHIKGVDPSMLHITEAPEGTDDFPAVYIDLFTV